MKCPIKLSPAVSEFIKSRDLVYVGVGDWSNPIFREKAVLSFCVTKEGGHDPLDRMPRNSGTMSDGHYFVSRPDAKTHFPHCLPKARKPAKHIVPEGYVYLGLGGEFKRVSFFAGMYKESEGGEWQEHGSCMGTEDDWHYCAPANSEIARLNGHKTLVPTEAETLRKENAALKARVAELESEKEKLRAAIKALNNF